MAEQPIDRVFDKASRQLLPLVFAGMVTLATFIGIRILDELNTLTKNVQNIQVDIGGMKVEIKNLKDQVQRRNDQ